MSGSNDHDQLSDSSNDDEEEGEEEEEEENCGEDSDSDLGSCLCQENTGCLTTSLNCGGYRPFGTAATGACPGLCQCAEEEAWNSITPPRPNNQWFNNFVELRRQWSDHARTNCYRFDQSRKSKALYKHPLPTQKSTLPTNHSSLPADPPADTIIDPCYELETNSSCCQSGSHNNYNKRNHKNGLIIHGHKNHKNSHTIPDQQNCHTDHVTHDRHTCHTDHDTHIRHNYHTDHVTHDHHNHKKNHDTLIHHDHDDHNDYDKPHTREYEKLPSEQLYPRSVKTAKKCSPCGCRQGGCLCQPMPRPCNCPPPVKIDARANPECTCACPSSPECLCPPSERRFPPIKSRCPYAKLCRPTPRLPPGPKCRCTKCQPPLPVPCDPCTVSKCRVIRRKPCWVDKEVCTVGKTEREIDEADPEPAEHVVEVKIEADQVVADPVDRVQEISVDPVGTEEPVGKVEVIKIDRSVGKIDFEEEKPEFSCKKVSYHDSVEVKKEVDDHEEIFSIHRDDNVETPVAIDKEVIDITRVGKEAPVASDCADKVENSEEHLNDGNSCPERCGERCLAKCRPVEAKKCPRYQKTDSVVTKCSRKTEKIENLKNDEKSSKVEKSQESSDDNLLEKNSLDDWTFVDVEHSKRPIKLLNTINRAKFKRKQRNCDCEPEFDYVIVKFIRKISTDSIIIINKIFKKSDDLENLSVKSSNLSNILDDHEIISTMDLMSRPMSTI